MHKQKQTGAKEITRHVGLSVVCLASLSLSSLALGQTDPQANQPTAAAAPAAAAPELTEVQVTGTRIVREGYEAPTPVTAVGLQTLQDIPANNIGDTLNDLPVFQGSTLNSNTTARDTEGSVTELNLRNLNANRTLILFDGRRLPSATTENVPDIDLIPDALIQRVDVVTGGASAVYGSDAVAGVVNYVLDTNFTGIKGVVQGGVSGYGDNESEKIQLTLGTTFAGGRLHLLLSGDQRYAAELPGSARPWNLSGAGVIPNPVYSTGSTAPEFLGELCCVGLPGLYAGGVVLKGPLAGTAFGVAGVPFSYNYGTSPLSASPPEYQVGGDWQLSTMAGSTDLAPSDNSQHYFARLAFDIGPATQVYAQFMYGSSNTDSRCCYAYYPTGLPVSLSIYNPYLPASVEAAGLAAGVSTFSMGDTQRYNASTGGACASGTPSSIGGAAVGGPCGFGPHDGREIDVYVLGLKGNLNLGKNSYNWNLYGQQGIAVSTFANPYQSITANFDNALNAVRVGSYNPTYTAAAYPNPLGIASGTITCASNLLPLKAAAETTNCVPYNPFGIGVASQAAIDYTAGSPAERLIMTQSSLGGDITGEPFSDWAGPISVALDAEYRRDSIGGNSDTTSAASGFFSTNLFAFDANQHVIEGALETVVPLVKNLPGIQELDANGAARATDYSISGYVTTYKYGLEYTPINDLRFRAVYSEDIRAPNLSDLYGYAQSHGTTTDIFMNNQGAPAYTITGGNTALRPEKAHQYELGLVLQPSEVPGLNLSADYYHIAIAGAISTLSTTFELQACFASQIPGTFTGTSPYCSLIKRNPAPVNTLYSVEVIPINIASYLAEGVDYQGDYRKQLTELVSSWKGALDFHVSATNTIHVITNTGISGPTQITDAAGTANSPRWALLGTLTYELDPWRFAWSERYNSATLPSSTYIVCPTSCPSKIPTGYSTIGVEPRIPTYFVANLAVSYKFMEQDQKDAEVFININNLLNKVPPFSYGTAGTLFSPVTNTTLFDVVGIYVRAGVRFRL